MVFGLGLCSAEVGCWVLLVFQWCGVCSRGSRLRPGSASMPRRLLECIAMKLFYPGTGRLRARCPTVMAIGCILARDHPFRCNGPASTTVCANSLVCLASCTIEASVPGCAIRETPDYVPLHECVHESIHPSIHPSIHRWIDLFIYLIYSFIYLSF